MYESPRYAPEARVAMKAGSQRPVAFWNDREQLHTTARRVAGTGWLLAFLVMIIGPLIATWLAGVSLTVMLEFFDMVGVRPRTGGIRDLR